MSHSKLNYIVVASVVLLSAAFGGALVRPGMNDLDARYDAVREKMDVVETKQAEVGDVSRLYAAIQELDRAIEDYDVRLPRERDFGPYLEGITHSLRANNIPDYIVQPRTALSVDAELLPKDLALARGTMILPVQVSFRGSFESLFGFLDGLESMDRLSHVQTMELTNTESDPGQVSVSLVVYTYYQTL